jgi:hypothetical protein
MNTVFVVASEGRESSSFVYPGYKHVLACAKAFAGGRVFSIAKEDQGFAEHVPLQDYYGASNEFRDKFLEVWPEPRYIWHLNSYVRWFAIRDLMKRSGLDYPVFTPDWDLMIFQNVAEACKPFSMWECLLGGSAYYIRHAGVLDEFCEAAMRALRFREHAHPTDMTIWQRLGINKYLIRRPEHGALFDINIHLKQGCQLDAGADKFNGRSPKKIYWIDGRPHFMDLASAELVKANCIHCWGSFKEKTGELAGKAGL